ncbi:MAG TPA: hypothetical protein VM689_23935 [Aliidongia sp.]|nr:hypothetical protein [Aliidongia sp.]
MLFHDQPAPRPSADPPPDVDMIGPGARVLVCAWRKIVTAGGECPLVYRDFADFCGEDAGEVLATFGTFLRVLAYASRRKLRVGHPGSTDITGDERQILAMLAAAQAGEADLLAAHLCWLARTELRHALTLAIRALGSALGANGLELPLPSAPKAAQFRGNLRITRTRMDSYI